MTESIDTEARSAVASILDVLEELVCGLAYTQQPGRDWADVVAATFATHREALGVRAAGQ